MSFALSRIYASIKGEKYPREVLELKLANIYRTRVVIHTHVNDIPGSLALDDRAISIYKKLSKDADSVLISKRLATAYLSKAVNLRGTVDLAGAMRLYNKA